MLLILYHDTNVPTVCIYCCIHGTYNTYVPVLLNVQVQYVCIVIKVWINQVSLSNLLVVSWTEIMNISLSPFAPENLVSRDRFGRLVLRQSAPSPHSDCIWCLLAGSLQISAATSNYLYHHTPSGQSRVYWVAQLRAMFTAETPSAQGQ